MAEKRRLRHPREVEILDYLKTIPFDKGIGSRIEARVQKMLDFYGKNQRLPANERESKELYSWIAGTKVNARNARASRGMVTLLNMFGAEIEYIEPPKTTRVKVHRPTRREVNPEPSRRKPQKEASFSSPAVLQVGEMKLRQEARTALRKLAPEGFSPRPGEDLGETVWWLRFWQWLHLEPGDKVEPQLRAFIDLQDRLIAERSLSERQLKLVEALRETTPDRRKPK